MSSRDEDELLGLRISPPAARAEDNEGLRSLNVTRLTDGAKGIWRRSLSDERRVSGYCEPCNRWITMTGFPVEFECPRCQRMYRVEFAVFEEMIEEDDDDD